MDKSFSYNLASLFLRLGTGAFMLTHGIPKMQMLFSGKEISFPDPLHVGVHASLALASFAEVVCSVFILLGLFSRFASAVLIFNMCVAAFVVHSGMAFAAREPAIMYLFLYVLVFIMGSGKYSVFGAFSEKSETCAMLNRF